MTAKDPKLYALGQRARKRAKDRAGGGRAGNEHLAPEVFALDQAGYTNAQIAYALDVGVRRVQQIRAFGGKNGSVYVTPAVVDPEKWDDEQKAEMEFSADGFERFYEHYGPGWALLPLHKSWVHEFCTNTRVILNVPPRHAKSHIFVVYVPLWLITMDRNHQILVVSAGNDLLSKLISELFNHMENDTELIEKYGPYKPEKQGGTWRPSDGEAVVLGRQILSRSGQYSIQVKGSGQNILGTEATVVIADDCTDLKVTRSHVENKRRMDWLREEVFSRLEPYVEGTAQGRIAVIGQRVGYNDIYQQLVEQMEEVGDKQGETSWKLVMYPAILRWADEDPEHPEPLVLWPEKWSYEQLLIKRNDMRRGAFTTMFQQQPLDADEAWIKPGDLRGMRDLDRAMGEGYKPEDETEAYFPIVRTIAIDPSPKMWNAMVVAETVTLPGGNFHCTILECSQWKGGMKELQHHLDQAISRYQPDYFILESSTVTQFSEGDPYFQMLRSRVTCLFHSTGSNKHHEEWGVDSLRADIEQRRITTPYGDPAGMACTALLERQAEFYGTNMEDDILMALWFIKFNYRKLVPRRGGTNTFTKKQGGWGYLSREKKQRDPRADMIREWEKRHGLKARQSA